MTREDEMALEPNRPWMEEGQQQDGATASAPGMPRLNFRRLMVEFRQVERAILIGQAPGLVRCEPVEDSLLEWEVDMVFEKGSSLQSDLDMLAESCADASLGCVTVRLRFPPDYPAAPPEVWVRRPRLRYQSAPVTFGGKVCSGLLSSHGWSPATSTLHLLRELRRALPEAGARIDDELPAKRGYPAAPAQLHRLRTNVFPEANDFVKHDMMVMSAAQAAPFLGDVLKLESTDKVILPFEFADEIYGRASRHRELDLPLMFEVKTQLGRKTHCAIYDFAQGLPPNCMLLPKWVMQDLFLDERESVSIRGVKLNLITYVKVQPHNVDFYRAVAASGVEVNALLTESLKRFSALTEDCSVPVEIDGQRHWVQVVKLEPQGAVRIIDTDVVHDFEFQVDFDPAPDLEDEAALKARQDRLLADYRNRHEQCGEVQRLREARLATARRQHFRRLVEATRSAAEGHDGSDGDVAMSLRLPNGSQIRARFREGAPLAALAKFVLDSDWAHERLPWGLRFATVCPRRPLEAGHKVGRDLHRSAVCVEEEKVVPTDEELLELIAPERAGVRAGDMAETEGNSDEARLGAVAAGVAEGAAAAEATSADCVSGGTGADAGTKALTTMCGVVSLFSSLEEQGDGTIGQVEFLKVFEALSNETFSEANLLRLLAASDTTCDGRVRYAAFFAWVFAGQVHLPERDAEALWLRTRRAFEVQRFVQAGLQPAEAESLVDLGEVLPSPSPPEVEESMRRPQDLFVGTEAAAGLAAAPHAPESPSGWSLGDGAQGPSPPPPEERERLVQEVVAVTGVDAAIATEALEEMDWDPEAATNTILDEVFGR